MSGMWWLAVVILLLILYFWFINTGPWYTTSYVILHKEMRRVWTEHVMWTREYIMAAVNKPERKDVVVARLLQNQDDIGTVLKPYIGASGAAGLVALLKEHISIAGKLVDATVAGGEAIGLRRQWSDNGVAIATAIHNAIPTLPLSGLRTMMEQHLNTTIDEVTAAMSNARAGHGQVTNADVTAYDVVQSHILVMADALTNGIVRLKKAKFLA